MGVIAAGLIVVTSLITLATLQVNADGTPFVELAHVVQCLAKVSLAVA